MLHVALCCSAFVFALRCVALRFVAFRFVDLWFLRSYVPLVPLPRADACVGGVGHSSHRGVVAYVVSS